MSEEVTDHHIAGSSNVSLLLGNWPIFLMNDLNSRSQMDQLKSKLDSVDGDFAVVGLRVSPFRGAVHWLGSLIGLKPRPRGSFEYVENAMGELNWEIEDGIAVFPSLESARFCFPISDTDSHRFLINDILFARRYSLASRTRFLLWVYRFLVTMLPHPTFLYRAVYVLIRRL